MNNLLQKNLFRLKNILNNKLIRMFLLYVSIYILVFYPIRNGFGQYWDSTFPYFKDHIKNIFLNKNYSWIELNFGQPLDYSTDYILRFFLSLFNFVNPETFRYCLYVLLFSLSSLGVFLITNKKLTVKWSFLLGLVALINPAIFYKFISGHLNYLLSYLIFIYLTYYLLFKFNKNFKSAIVVGLLLSFIGAQIQFFVIGFLFIVLFFCFNKNKFNLNYFVIICLLPFLINLIWLSNFILGANEISKVSRSAAKGSFIDLQEMDFINIFNLSFSKATLISRFYETQYLYFFIILFLFLFLFLLKNKIKDKISGLFFVYLMILMILSTGIYFSFQIWPINILYPMFREVGHFAPLIILLLILSISAIAKKGKIKNIFFYFIIIFFIINLTQFHKYPNTISFSYMRQQFNSFEENNTKDDSAYRILPYPFFGQYSISNINTKRIDGFLLNNTGFDSFMSFAGKDFANKPTLPNFKSSIQYRLLKTYDLEILKPYNIKYIYNFSDIYESNIEKYIPAHIYDNDLSLIKNDKDFFDKLIEKNPGKLEKIDENILYINDYVPRIFSLDNVFLLNLENEEYNTLNFVKNVLKEDFYYTTSDDIANNNSVGSLSVLFALFENIEENDIKDNRIINENKLLNKKNSNFVYINEAKTNLYYSVNDNKIKFYTKHGNNLLINNEYSSIKNINDTILYEDNLNPNQKYYIYLGTQLLLIQNDKRENLGAINKNNVIKLYSTDNQNFIPNASFQEGLWNKEVGDCNAYDDNPVLDMKIGIMRNNSVPLTTNTESIDENSKENRFLQLEAISHIACTTNTFDIQKNTNYLFSFDYQSPNAKNAGYYLQFNDKDKTIVSERIFVENTKWNTYTKKIESPIDATSARLYLYAYATDEKTNIINRYDNFSLIKLNLEKEIKIDYKPKFRKKEIELVENNTFEYIDDNYSYENIISNGSFENGLWQEKVGDCYNHDNDPKIAMRLNNDYVSAGKNSLQLEAEKHVACINTEFSIKENTTYLFNFDYQSPNAKKAGYHLQFNNEEKTTISEKLDVENQDWQKFTKKIKTPLGANSVRLYVYAYQSAEKTNNIVHYDNFQFRELPDLEDRFYLVSDPELNLRKPESVEFELVNPTKKIVRIKGASTPFFLAMSESFHPQWRLEMNNEKVNGFFNKWIPFVKPDKVSDDDHFELNGFLNAWYVDVNELCNNTNRFHSPNGTMEPAATTAGSACVLNANGSYDLEMAIEFTPQRWFYLGLLISGTTLLGCLGYLGWDWRRRRKLHKKIIFPKTQF